jgi:hypothetical protein
MALKKKKKPDRGMVFVKQRKGPPSLQPYHFKDGFLILNDLVFRRLLKEVQSLKQPYLKRKRKKSQLEWLLRKNFSTSRYYFNRYVLIFIKRITYCVGFLPVT